MGGHGFSSGTKLIQVDSRKFKARPGSLSGAESFKRERKWVERETGKIILNDAHKKEREGGGGKRGSRKLSELRRRSICDRRKETRSLQGTVGLRGASSVCQALSCVFHVSIASRHL